MREFSVSVLGTPYKCSVGSRKELTGLDKEFQGCCKYYVKEILVCDEFTSDTGEEEYGVLKETVVHELAHAFLYESGLLDYSQNEELVDWISINMQKLLNCVTAFMEMLNLTDEAFSAIIK